MSFLSLMVEKNMQKYSSFCVEDYLIIFFTVSEIYFSKLVVQHKKLDTSKNRMFETAYCR
jgi:hypothetical protein